MNSTSREIRRLNIKSFFYRRGLWRCYRCCWSCFLLFGQRASACTFDHLFQCSAELVFGGLFVACHLSKHFSAVHSIVIIWAGYIRLFWGWSGSSFACNQNIKEDISIALEVLLCFKTKRNETWTNLPRKNPRNARVISAKDLGTMSKNNLRRISLVRGPIWGIHSLTLIIRWF